VPTISRWVINLMFPLPLIPVSAWFMAQSFTARIARNDQWTSALVHTLEVDVFAVILAISMLINATIVTVRRPITPLTFLRFGKLPLWVLIVFVLSLVWLVALSASPTDTSAIEQLAGVGVAASSIVTCTYASKQDRDSIILQRLRRTAMTGRLVSIPPQTRARRRKMLLAVVVPIATAALLTGAANVTAGEIITVRHTNCSIGGLSEFGDGEILVDTTRCGSFAVDGGPRVYDRLSHAMDTSDFTITSRGWTFGLPPRQQAITITTN
jgi:hypothetical protein